MEAIRDERRTHEVPGYDPIPIGLLQESRRPSRAAAEVHQHRLMQYMGWRETPTADAEQG